MKKLLSGIAPIFLLLGMVGIANAALTTIGTATYEGSDYNLIWDDDNNGNSVVWLDYTRSTGTWTTQRDWAFGLDSAINNIQTPDYIIDWGANSWRLPSAGTTPSTGYNQITSEMGHLWYTELGFSEGDEPSDAELNASNFEELRTTWYFTGTTISPGWAWYFYMGDGAQGGFTKSSWRHALAIRSGQVSPVPVPGGAWLLCSGLIALVGVRRKLKK